MLPKIAFLLFGILFLVGCTVPTPSNTPENPTVEITQENPPSPNLTTGQDLTGLNLNLPDGFTISTFAENLSNARDMVIDSQGNMWVSRNGTGKITMIEIKDGKAVASNDIFQGLNNPHGLALDPKNPNMLYIAEENKISRIPLYSDAPLQKIADLPSGGRHVTRSLVFGDDDKLYVSIGSTCDVCVEKNPMHGTIYVMNKDGSDMKLFAKGLRNAVFMTRHPETGAIWATEMGRDFLGDNTPPDEINIIQEGKNYGWPYCYGKNIKDTEFNNSQDPATTCAEPAQQPSTIDIPAHSAPLGLAFSANGNWPKEYRDDLLVAYHGSTNSSKHTGYKVVRFLFDDQGNYKSTEDFITGWLTPNGNVSGRPVGILIHENAIYISDDKKGVIYKVTAAS